MHFEAEAQALVFHNPDELGAGGDDDGGTAEAEACTVPAATRPCVRRGAACARGDESQRCGLGGAWGSCVCIRRAPPPPVGAFGRAIATVLRVAKVGAAAAIAAFLCARGGDCALGVCCAPARRRTRRALFVEEAAAERDVSIKVL